MKHIAKNLKVYAAGILVLIFCAVFGLGIVRNANETKFIPVMAETDATMQDPIEQFRMEREQLRAMQKAQLNDILHGEGTDEEIISLAQRQLLELCRQEEMELTIEGVLSMRGFRDPVATVHGDSVNVLIRSELITRQESSLILDLVCRETGAQSGNVKIIPIN